MSEASHAGGDPAGGAPALEIAPAKTSVLLGEPVILALRASGASEVSRSLDLRCGVLDIWATDASGVSRRVSPAVHIHGLGSPGALSPGDDVVAEAMLACNSDGGPFPAVGRYEVQVSTGPPYERLEANTVVVEVASPKGIDAEALHLFWGGEQALFLEIPAPQLTDGMGRLQELVQRYPTSTYTPYALYALGVCASRDAVISDDSGDLEYRPAGREAAIALFRQIVWRHSGSPVGDDAQYELARTYFERRDAGAARRALDVFNEQFGTESGRATQAEALSMHLSKTPGEPFEPFRVKLHLPDSLRGEPPRTEAVLPADFEQVKANLIELFQESEYLNVSTRQMALAGLDPRREAVEAWQMMIRGMKAAGPGWAMPDHRGVTIVCMPPDPSGSDVTCHYISGVLGADAEECGGYLVTVRPAPPFDEGLERLLAFCRQKLARGREEADP